MIESRFVLACACTDAQERNHACLFRVWQRNMEDPIASINSPAATASIKGVQAAVFAPGSNHVVYAVDKVGGVAAWDLRSCSQRMSRSDEQSLHIRQRVTLAGIPGETQEISIPFLRESKFFNIACHIDLW